MIESMAEAEAVAGTLGFPSKMPGTSYGISARACRTGGKLALVEGTVCHQCYAFRGFYGTPGVVRGQARRMEGLRHPLWTEAMVFMLRRAHGLDGGKVHPKVLLGGGTGYHRWHDSGDLQGGWHLSLIAGVARLTPGIRHWLPTREAGIVRAWLRNNACPPNLVIRVSATLLDGAPPTWAPLTSTVHRHGAALGHDCPARHQDKRCGSCRACWDATVANVSYPKH